MKTLVELLSSLAAEEDGTLQGPLLSFWEADETSRAVSYASIYEGAERVAAQLLQLELAQGERVAILLPTHPHFLMAFFGVQLAGLVPSALYPPLRLGKLDEWRESTTLMLKALKAPFVITDRKIYPFLGESVVKATPKHGCQTMESLLGNASVVPTGGFPEVHPEDLAFVQFSSGSTGRPKPVGITHQNALANASAIIARFSLPEGDPARRTVSWLPLYHDMGLVGVLLTSMLARAPLLLLRPEEFLVRPLIWPLAISRFRAGISVAPNFAYGLCARKVKDQELSLLDLSCWKVALCGAETIHPDTFSRFVARFTSAGLSEEALTPVYGLAEATLAVTFYDRKRSASFVEFSPELLQLKGEAEELVGGTALANLGRTLDAMAIEIRDDEGQPLPPQKLGRVWVKGPSVMKGYLDGPEETSLVLKEGWLDTGDRGFLYRDDLFLYGRYKEILIHRGRNYDPTSLERAASQVPGLREGGIVAGAVFDPSWDTERILIMAEVLPAFLTKGREWPEETKRRVKGAVLERNQLLVSEVVLLPPGTLPKTSSGKLQRRKALELYAQGKLKAPRKVSAPYLARELLKGIMWHWRQRLRPRSFQQLK